MTYHFRAGKIDEYKDLIIRHHYRKSLPTCILFMTGLHEKGGLFGDFGPCVASAIFSDPPTRWSEPILELSRLVAAPDFDGSLSQLISKSTKFLKRKGCDLIVSFADMTHNHHGGVYQACSWEYAGFRKPKMDGLLVDGVFIPGRTCNDLYGTRSPNKVRERIGRSVEPSMDAGKYLYFKVLGSVGRRKAERLGLRNLPYPKPERLHAAAE